jgi:hypothetical protein
MNLKYVERISATANATSGTGNNVAFQTELEFSSTWPSMHQL